MSGGRAAPVVLCGGGPRRAVGAAGPGSPVRVRRLPGGPDGTRSLRAVPRIAPYPADRWPPGRFRGGGQASHRVGGALQGAPVRLDHRPGEPQAGLRRRPLDDAAASRDAPPDAARKAVAAGCAGSGPGGGRLAARAPGALHRRAGVSAAYGGGRIAGRPRLPVHHRGRGRRDPHLLRGGRIDRHLKNRRRTVKRSSAVVAAVFVALLVLLRGGGFSVLRAQADSPPSPPQETSSPQLTPAPPGPSPLGMRTFSLRYKKVDDAYLLISPYVGPRGSVKMQPAQRTLTVQDVPENLQRISGLIGSYDVPPRSVEVAVQLILASSGDKSQEPTPPPIRGVIDKLNALSTRWSDYKMVGNARVLGTEGERSSLRVGDDYRVDFRIDQVSDETRVIRFKPFELSRREAAVEGNERYASIMQTVLNLRDSQLFIVGASKVEQSNRALFMTITASLQQP